MPLTPEQFIKRLSALTDPSYLCEVLNITSEDIIERFEDLVEEKSEILKPEAVSFILFICLTH